MALNLRTSKPAGYLLEGPGLVPDIRLFLSDAERQQATAQGYQITDLFRPGSQTGSQPGSAPVPPTGHWCTPATAKPEHDGSPRRKGVAVWGIYHSHFSKKLHVGEMEFHRVWGWRPVGADDWDYQCLLWQPLPEIPLAVKLKFANLLGRERAAKLAAESQML
jgi:hypothetical protein